MSSFRFHTGTSHPKPFLPDAHALNPQRVCKNLRPYTRKIQPHPQTRILSKAPDILQMLIELLRPSTPKRVIRGVDDAQVEACPDRDVHAHTSYCLTESNLLLSPLVTLRIVPCAIAFQEFRLWLTRFRLRVGVRGRVLMYSLKS